MTRLRAQYDGKVFVPMEDVDLPVGAIELEVHESHEPRAGSAQAILEALRKVSPVDPTIVDELERAIEEGKSPPVTRGVFDDLTDE